MVLFFYVERAAGCCGSFSKRHFSSLNLQQDSVDCFPIDVVALDTVGGQGAAAYSVPTKMDSLVLPSRRN